MYYLLELCLCAFTISLRRTAYSRIQLLVQYPPTYPAEIAIVELSSPSVPPKLLRAKEKECRDIAKQHVNRPQLSWIFHFIDDFIHTNLFIPCWKEVKQVISLCNGKGQIGADDKEGLLNFRLGQGQYYHCFCIRVPYGYPEDGVKIHFASSNFPEDIQKIYLSQAEEICRRCVAGFHADVALQVALLELYCLGCLWRLFRVVM